MAPLVPLLGEKHLEKCSDRETTSTTKGSIAQCFKLTEYYLVLHKCEVGPIERSVLNFFCHIGQNEQIEPKNTV